MSAVIIPARLSSTRLPGKVLKEICGKPMILRVAEQCLLTKADRVIVAADNESVALALEGSGIEVVLTDPSLPTGTDRIATVAKNLTDDIVINVQGDEPFIPPELIDSLIDQLYEDKSLNMNTACVPFDNEEDALNPSHVKVVLDKAGYALYFSRSPIPYDRDGAGEVTRYRHIGIYGFRRGYLLKYAGMPKTTLENIEMLEQLRALENGDKIKVAVTNYKPLSIDTAEDLERAIKFMTSKMA